jgi:Na+/proline symporter
MEKGIFILDSTGMTVVIVYLILLIIIGLAGRFARKENSMDDFYLGGRNLGIIVLLLTLYATQYSGNTLFGFSGSAYRNGFWFLLSVTFMMAVIAGYLLYAPRLYYLSRHKRYLTTSDFIQDRYNFRPLSILVSLIGIVALCNFILSNLKAIGLFVESGSANISMAQGVITFAFIVVLYETLGGMRSVAWTDVLQGLVLFVGCLLIFGVIIFQLDGLHVLSVNLREVRPEFWNPPTIDQKMSWLSSILIVGFGISLYPQAIQRIYAAKSKSVLKRSLQVMVFLPFVTTLFMLTVGWVGAAKIPGLGKEASDTITVQMLNYIITEVPQMQVLLIVFVAAVFAASLLSISSSITKDIYAPLRPNSSQAELTLFGKLISWLLMAAMTVLALITQDTIWRLIEIKLELLIQIAPAIFLGIHTKRLCAGPVFAGLIVGTAITLFYVIAIKLGADIPDRPFGIHAGLWGLIVNLVIIGMGSLLKK